MWDLVNGMFELFGGAFVLLSCIKLYKQKQVRGVSTIGIAYFTAWGYWNLAFYPHLGQWLSFAGSMTVTLVNTFWLGQIIYYIRKEKHDKNSLS